MIGCLKSQLYPTKYILLQFPPNQLKKKKKLSRSQSPKHNIIWVCLPVHSMRTLLIWVPQDRSTPEDRDTVNQLIQIVIYVSPSHKYGKSNAIQRGIACYRSIHCKATYILINNKSLCFHNVYYLCFLNLKSSNLLKLKVNLNI